MGCGPSNAAEVHSRNSGSREPAVAVIPVATRSVPLVLSTPYKHGAAITQAQVDTQRAQFWASRGSYNWQALRTAAEAMLAEDLSLASAVLEASNIVSSNGSLELCFDEAGQRYKVPLYCYAHPMELRYSADSKALSDNAPSSSSKKSDGTGPSDPMTLKIRVSPGDLDLAVDVETGMSIHEVKRQICQQGANKPPPKDFDPENKADVAQQQAYMDLDADRQRLLYMGRELNDAQILRDCKVDPTKVMQVFLRLNKQ